MLGKVSRHLLILNCVKLIACLRNVVKTDDLNRYGGACGLNRSALVVYHRSDTAGGVSYDDIVTLVESTVLYKDGCYRTATAVKLGLDNKPPCSLGGIGSKLLNLGYKKDVFKKILDTHTGKSRYGNSDNVTAPALGYKLVLSKLIENVIGISLGLIHFVNCYDNINACGLCVVYSLNGLGHYTVVGGYYQNCDIGGLSTSHTHGGEGLVTGGVKEGDVLTVGLYAVCAYGLGNSACLALGDVGVSDSVKDGGLTVVNVTHNANYGRTLDHILFLVLCLVKELLLDGYDNLLGYLCAKGIGNDLGSTVIDYVIYHLHLAKHKELLNYLCGALFESQSKLGDGDLVGNGDLKLLVSGSFGLHALDLLLSGALLILCALLILTLVILFLQLLLVALAVCSVKDGIILIVIVLVVLGQVNVGGSHIHDPLAGLSGGGICVKINASLYP